MVSLWHCKDLAWANMWQLPVAVTECFTLRITICCFESQVNSNSSLWLVYYRVALFLVVRNNYFSEICLHLSLLNTWTLYFCLKEHSRALVTCNSTNFGMV